MVYFGDTGTKTAVMSDIHSNFHAFKACYEDAVKCGAGRFIFLGDYVSDLSLPLETMDLLYEIKTRFPTVCLRGNREGYMLDCEKGMSQFSVGSRSGSLLFTYEKLRRKDLDFFRELKISDQILIDGIPVEIAHAAMDRDRYYFDCYDGGTSEIFHQMNSKYLLTGHSHKQYIIRSSDKTIINPGSVGIPQEGSNTPKYAVLETVNGEISCEFREVQYDLRAAIHAQFASGLVDTGRYWAIGILYDIITGEDWVLRLLKSVEKTGELHNEEAWRSHAARLGMKLTEREILELAETIRPPQCPACT